MPPTQGTRAAGRTKAGTALHLVPWPCLVCNDHPRTRINALERNSNSDMGFQMLHWTHLAMTEILEYLNLEASSEQLVQRSDAICLHIREQHLCKCGCRPSSAGGLAKGCTGQRLCAIDWLLTAPYTNPIGGINQGPCCKSQN